MKRILVVYNPRSSRYAEVRQGVIEKTRDLKGCIVGKYEVKKGGIEKNVEDLASVLKDEDLVITAGGDATGVIVANAIMRSGKDATMAALPYGNFNDLARTLETKTLEVGLGRQEYVFLGTLPRARRYGARSLRIWPVAKYAPRKSISCRLGKLYPLEILVDGKLWRYATCYVTIGMTAEVVKTFDHPGARKILKSSGGRTFGSYFHLAGWYFQNKHKKTFLPEFSLNGVKQNKKASDYLAVNGRSMARVMRGGDEFLRPRVFRSSTARLTSFCRLIGFMCKSILVRIPGEETKGDVLTFDSPARIEIQAEGESEVFEGVRKVEIRKTSKSINVIVGRQ